MGYIGQCRPRFDSAAPPMIVVRGHTPPLDVPASHAGLKPDGLQTDSNCDTTESDAEQPIARGREQDPTDYESGKTCYSYRRKGGSYGAGRSIT